MAKKWTEDTELLNGMAANLLDMLAVFPKQMMHLDRLVREFGMPLSHIQILVVLSQGDLSIGSLSEKMGIAKPNITPLVDTLCEKKLAERIRSEEDRRVVNVHLMAGGAEMLEQIRASVAKQVTEWTLPMSRSEAKEMNAAFASILRLTAPGRGSEEKLPEEKQLEEKQPEEKQPEEKAEAADQSAE